PRVHRGAGTRRPWRRPRPPGPLAGQRRPGQAVGEGDPAEVLHDPRADPRPDAEPRGPKAWGGRGRIPGREARRLCPDGKLTAAADGRGRAGRYALAHPVACPTYES